MKEEISQVAIGRSIGVLVLKGLKGEADENMASLIQQEYHLLI